VCLKALCSYREEPVSQKQIELLSWSPHHTHIECNVEQGCMSVTVLYVYNSTGKVKERSCVCLFITRQKVDSDK
jgi:hypothetical protein